MATDSSWGYRPMRSMGTMAHEPAPCTVKTPVTLQVGDVRTELGRPGVAVMDVVFPHLQTIDLQEIVFKNYYTAFLTLRVQCRSPADDENESPNKWVTCLRNYCLMPNPHTEEGSQEYFSFSRHQMRCDVDRVSSLRLIMRQPSPVWMHFSIEDLRLFPGGQKSPQKGFPAWLSHPSPQGRPENLHEGLPDAERVSSEVQQMWVLTEMLQASQPASRIGRFDVGSLLLLLISLSTSVSKCSERDLPTSLLPAVCISYDKRNGCPQGLHQNILLDQIQISNSSWPDVVTQEAQIKGVSSNSEMVISSLYSPSSKETRMACMNLLYVNLRELWPSCNDLSKVPQYAS
ncbi:hypothetical protein lerEdw1_016073 [Lerista edwardsae]|nr:hypothetical protein lerEdw1_016073 [Lerista edwardsae]